MKRLWLAYILTFTMGGLCIGVAVSTVVTTSACASMATRHPLLDPVGQRAAYALDAIGIAEKASTALKASVDSGAVKMSQGIADALNVLSAVGDTCHDLGVLLDGYNRTADGVAKVKAASAIEGKIAALDTLVLHMPVDHIEDAVKDLIAKVKQLKGAK